MEIWKAVSSRFILKDKTFTILLILIMELGYPRKRRVNRNRGGWGEFWKLLLLGGGKTTHLAVERVCLGDQGKGKIIKINYEKNFIHNSCQKCSLHFKSSLHWLLQVYCITRKMHISQELTFFGSPLSVTRHNSSALFYLKLFILWTRRAHQNSNFRNCDCSHEN